MYLLKMLTKCNVFIVFDDLVADMISNKKRNQIVTPSTMV